VTLTLKLEVVQEVMRSVELKREMGKLAIKHATIVRTQGPKGSSGAYRRSIVIGKVKNEKMETHISVGSTDQFAHLIEFGSAKNKPYRPLTMAGRQMGLKFEDFGKGGKK
jgi:hypothetical protein